ANGHKSWGKALALAGMGTVGFGGALGGHITYYRAGGANRADHFIDVLPEGWHDLGPLDHYPQEGMGGGDVDGVPVVVTRTEDTVSVLLGSCAHMGAPLSEGELVQGGVRCPWHGNEIRATDGTVGHRPAPTDQVSCDGVVVGLVDVVLVGGTRTEDTVSVLCGSRPHMGAPLSEGELVQGCVRCPWHGSEFRADDGTVVHGPATASLESLETSIVDGRLWVRPRMSVG